MLREYLKQIFETAKRGDAREESFYPHLKQLTEAFAHSRGKKGVHVTTLPKKTEAGNPDFRIWDGKQHIIGYIFSRLIRWYGAEIANRKPDPILPPILPVENAYKLDDVRDALRAGDVKRASQLADRVYRLTPV